MDQLERLLQHTQDELINEVLVYKRLKYTKYFIMLTKTSILSLSIGLSFINPLMVLSAISIPILDSFMLVTDNEKRLASKKLKKDLLKEIIVNIEDRKINIKEHEIDDYITYIRGRLRSVNTF